MRFSSWGDQINGLPKVLKAPDDLTARGETLYGAWLCGTVLGTVGMALHQPGFERRGERPDELIRIRYDSRENLIAMGILPTTTVPPLPNPFPGAPHPGYAPDPY